MPGRKRCLAATDPGRLLLGKIDAREQALTREAGQTQIPAATDDRQPACSLIMHPAALEGLTQAHWQETPWGWRPAR